MSKEKAYLFHQNNSGGVFVIDDKLCPRVYIKAVSAEEANKKAEEIGIYFNGVINDIDCPCCGDRWYPVSEGDAVEKYPNAKWDFIWCDYVIVYDVDMKPIKIFKEFVE